MPCLVWRMVAVYCRALLGAAVGADVGAAESAATEGRQHHDGGEQQERDED